ncbi:MAG TPA: 2-succinyl-5-enolpyruvyl-6-hydroxy-3-cyclohexene-1-carboxylic-acid synthase [Solirubrobacteraceae bacterium]|nr:2-succinyl-5-enolpyruvyl-6-hydroxy-3-cyclohexene-1-carboxylic-acid synthase [Solirubrobacteraceae bacterium]
MTATDTYLLLRAFCDELARCGLQHACTSPGSRNTPILLSLAREPGIKSWSHLDERCAGFFALGAAKASGRPVAVTCTSGTAAANLAPAVIEAHEAHVPLLVLTADRPPELREVGAGQTIDQLKLYGDAVKWFFEVGVHEATSENLRWIRTLACRAYATAIDGAPGPVHLNFPLREPLIAELPLPDDPTGRADGRPYVIVEPPHIREGLDGAGPHPSGRLLIVAGAGTLDPAGLAAYAERSGIPLLADPLSGARRGGAAIAHYDLLLRSEAFTESRRPEFIFRVGELPTSKPLRTWLAALPDVAQIAFDPYHTWHDPGSVVGMRIHGAPPRPDGLNIEPGWLESWRAADRTVAEVLERIVDDQRLSEPLVAARLAAQLPARAILFTASSMPVRDLEEFAAAREDPPRTLSNRGANGIDGTVSSAFGVAATAGGPVVLLIGDVALAHDIGGLLAARRLGLALTIVVVNNDGGGIFHFLPVAGETDAFEEHVATPHGLDFAHAAAFYGCEYERPQTAAELSGALGHAIAAGGTTIIEIRTDRTRNLELHRRVANAVAG